MNRLNNPYKPGLNKTFTLTLTNDIFNKEDILYSPNKYLFLPWYLRLLGFSYNYKGKVVSDPIATLLTYSYMIEVLDRDLSWLGIKIKTTKWNDI